MKENDVMYLVQQIKIMEKLPAEDLQILRKLEITLKHPPLPQHEIETRAGSRPPTHKEIERFAEYAPLKRGYYSPAEDDIIVHNWKAFCELHNWDVKKVQPFLLLREGSKSYIRSKKQRRKFAQFLADGLPNRTLYSVYHRFRILYENRVRRRYEPEEDSMIIDHIENNPSLDEKRKFADLAKVLKRSRLSVWRRYRILKEKRRKLQFNLK